MSVNFRPNKFYARQGLRVVCEVPVAFARSSSDRMNDPLNWICEGYAAEQTEERVRKDGGKDDMTSLTPTTYFCLGGGNKTTCK